MYRFRCQHIMELSRVAVQWIASFNAFGMDEPSILTKSDLPDDQSVNNQLGPSTTTPVATTNFSLNSSEYVVGTIKFSVAQLSSMQCSRINFHQVNCQLPKELAI